MQFKANAHVVGSDGKDVGHLRRVVIDPADNEIRDLVVRQGTLLSQDRVVPIEDVADADEEHVHLRIDAHAVEALDPFEEQYYLPANGTGAELAPMTYWYPPMIGYTPPSLAAVATPDLLGYRLRRQRHIPDNTIALKEGATVKSKDDHTVGKVEQIIAAPVSDEVTHLVLAEGRLHKAHKVIPLEWVKVITESEIRLAVPASLIENLPDYEPAA